MKSHAGSAERVKVPDPAPTIRIQCPNLPCQRILAVTEACRGKLVRCRGCQTLVRVPEKGSWIEPGARARVRVGEKPQEA